ncbi:MAG TPA: radical SAM protein, partial [Planctomycetes bacterium]|nr:radical SAM protein [Planctomycetota bacterium]
AIGEGERSIIPLADALAGKIPLSDVPGIAFMDGGKMVKTPPVQPVMDLDELPSIDFSLLEGGLQRGFFSTVVPVMTSRGCPFNCSFCAVTKMFGHRYRFRSPAKVIEDLMRVPSDSPQHVFFYDDHFTVHKERTAEIMERMRSEGFRFTWSAQVRTELGRDAKLLKLMKKAGLETVYVGLESINPETLKAYNKQQTVEQMQDSLKAFHRAGVRVHGMFVFGSDEDTVETIRQTVRFARRTRLESLQFMVLTPLPGSDFYQRVEAEGRLATKYWALFDGHHVTYEPRRMTPYELQTETFKAMRDFYSLWDCSKSLLKMKFVDAAIRFYARDLVKTWTRTHTRYLDDFRSSWRSALFNLEQEWRKRLVALRSAPAPLPAIPAE